MQVQILPSRLFALVTKLANVLVLETRFCGFNSHQGYWAFAQAYSRGEIGKRFRLRDGIFAGSIPVGSTKLGRKALRAYKKGRAGISRLLSGFIQVPFGNATRTTPGRPIQSWAFGRTVMLLTLNQADTGSTPVAPTKFCPCNPSGRGAKLKIWKLLVQIQSGVLVNMRGWSNGGSWGCIT